MRARLLALALLALLLPLLAGCIGSSGPSQAADIDEPDPEDLPDPVTVIEDPEGDATRQNSHWTQRATPCVSGPEGGTTCGTVDPALDRQEPAGAVPAHPARDILDVRLQETPRTLEVSMDVAELNEDMDGAIQRAEDDAGYHGTFYGVQWEDPRSGCTYVTGYLLQPNFERVSGLPVVIVDCIDGNASGPCASPFCWWQVPFEIDHGAPATLTWDVPRRMLASGQAGGTVAQPRALTGNVLSDEGISNLAVRAQGPISTSYVGPNEWEHALDRTANGTNFTFSTPRRSGSIPSGQLSLGTGEEFRVTGSPTRPDVRVANVTFTPEPDRLVFDVTLDRVAEQPRNHTLFIYFGVPGSQFTMGYVAEEGSRETFANRNPADGNPVSVPVSRSVKPGEPGHVVFELPRSEVPDLADGAILQDLRVYTAIEEGRDESAAGASLERQRWHEGDNAEHAPLHRIPAQGAASEPDDTERFGDEPGDVEAPRDLTGSPDRFDLLGTEIVSPAPDQMRFSISVDDLSELSPPTGYDAVFYAVAVEHPNGRTMIGHYQPQDPTGDAFLCGSDTTVMADNPSAPTGWTEIDGRILTSSASQEGGGDGARGSIVVTTPPSCFGLQPGAEELNVTALQAGSYLVRRQPAEAGNNQVQEEVQELDSLQPEDESDGDFAAAFADPPAAPAPSFWAQPFGIPNFWDIFGGALAVLTGLVTLGLFLRRRRTFKNYLAEVRRIQEEYRSDPEARALALVELRRDLYEDLEAHRISDSHYPIVLDRIRARLTSARLTSIGRAFYDLPTHIALRIEAMLDDGHLAEEECEVLDPIIEESGMGADAQDLLQDRLRRWVAQDREHLESGSAS